MPDLGNLKAPGWGARVCATWLHVSAAQITYKKVKSWLRAGLEKIEGIEKE